MKIKLFVLGVFTLSILINCKGDSNSEAEVSEKKSVGNQLDSRESEEEALSLNDGKKWEVNEEMLPHIEKSESIYKDFEGSYYQKLSKDMMAETNKLIQSCTMTGPSHDELHKWLHPHIELIKKLGKGDGEAEKAFEDLAVSFKTFHTFFK